MRRLVLIAVWSTVRLWVPIRGELGDLIRKVAARDLTAYHCSLFLLLLLLLVRVVMLVPIALVCIGAVDLIAEFLAARDTHWVRMAPLLACYSMVLRVLAVAQVLVVLIRIAVIVIHRLLLRVEDHCEVRGWTWLRVH